MFSRMGELRRWLIKCKLTKDLGINNPSNGKRGELVFGCIPKGHPGSEFDEGIEG